MIDRDFYTRHCATGGIILAVVVVDAGPMGAKQRAAVFSSLERAEEWATEVGEGLPTVFAPVVVDQPEFVPGEVARSGLN